MENGNLIIDTGVKRVIINGDPENFIQFNPTDVAFAENFQSLKGNLLKKIEEFPKRSEELEAKKKDADDITLNEIEKQGTALRREFCVYSREAIDKIFGEGVSQKVFGDLMSENAILSFLEGISPYIEIVRADKIAKYMPSKPLPPEFKTNRKRRPKK